MANLEREYEAAKAKLRGDDANATIVDLIEAVEAVRQTSGSALKPGNTASILAVLGDKKRALIRTCRLL